MTSRLYTIDVDPGDTLYDAIKLNKPVAEVMERETLRAHEAARPEVLCHNRLMNCPVTRELIRAVLSAGLTPRHTGCRGRRV